MSWLRSIVGFGGRRRSIGGRGRGEVHDGQPRRCLGWQINALLGTVGLARTYQDMLSADSRHEVASSVWYFELMVPIL